MGGEKMTAFWLLGSKSGWNGKDIPKKEQTFKSGTYRVTAVEGETLKAWLRCSMSGEHYSEFKVGRGDTRHICAYRGCVSNALTGCVLKQVLTSRFKLFGCAKHLA